MLIFQYTLCCFARLDRGAVPGGGAVCKLCGCHCKNGFNDDDDFDDFDHRSLAEQPVSTQPSTEPKTMSTQSGAPSAAVPPVAETGPSRDIAPQEPQS
ncbi:hypothetical protein EW146_g907 [Bondarzewia mesenterica]|uniref:Uncharacterized protein n=1 Tax=Bondarzewia mesenterica TaxID=1095465 RepID=A0A4S4M5K9_9AGAM|nr:hypothetical protein EW146_g907 [Bondarzewia mesenterica]